jgi:hypothetical protein
LILDFLNKICKIFKNLFVPRVNLYLQFQSKELGLLINNFGHPLSTDLLLHMVNFSLNFVEICVQKLVCFVRILDLEDVLRVFVLKVDDLVLETFTLSEEVVDYDNIYILLPVQLRQFH